MYFPLCVTTDHTLLKSMIKIKSLEVMEGRIIYYE